jgi:xylan 1,4-beta-xylosidase
MATTRWGAGPEGRRIADLGDGTYRNPVLAGDFPDPSVLKDGEDYYLTTSSFDAAPGLLLHHSRDLVNWTPLTFALPHPVSTTFAVDIAAHDGRYFIYIPFIPSAWAEPGFGRRRGSSSSTPTPWPGRGASRSTWASPVPSTRVTWSARTAGGTCS